MDEHEENDPLSLDGKQDIDSFIDKMENFKPVTTFERKLAQGVLFRNGEIPVHNLNKSGTSHEMAQLYLNEANDRSPDQPPLAVIQDPSFSELSAIAELVCT